VARPGDVWARKFRVLRARYPREPGKSWRGVDFERATNGYLSGSYITALSKGRIDEPGLGKIFRIAEVMGFPPELWFRNLDDEPAQAAVDTPGVVHADISERLNLLFDVVINDRTGEPFTEEEVARTSRGKLTAEDVVRIRTGDLVDPTREQLLALSNVFGVDFSFWAEEVEEVVLRPETIRALRDSMSQDILHKSLSLTNEDKNFVMAMLEELQKRREHEDAGSTPPTDKETA
jgi:transcriptional regulator with XRE-family HTH domain